MDFFDVENVRSVLKARWLRRPGKTPVLRGVGIDSREDLTGRIFVAIKGETHDGHGFLDAAVRAGAGLLIVEHEVQATAVTPAAAEVGILHVENSRRALGKLAQAYRRTLRGTRVIAVTGSAGKTTTKRLIHGVLATQMQGSASPRSFNNDIGLPLTILHSRLSDKYLVVEVGTNAPGEIAQLASLAEPDLAVVTSIGRAHLEGLGSVEAIAREKASLLTFLRPKGMAILNADAPALRMHFKLAQHRVLFGEAPDADLRLTGRGLHQRAGQGQPPFWFEVNSRHRFDLHLPGKHNAMNALAAVAIGRRLGLEDDSIAIGLRGVRPAAMRMTAQRIGDVTIYNDAYNANPDAVIASLNAFAEITADVPRRVVILGDMLELGPAGPDLHREIGRHLATINAQTKIDAAVLIGELSAFTASEAARQMPSDRIYAFTQLDAATSAQIGTIIRPGDAVLIKASRGMGLERLLSALEAEHAAHLTRAPHSLTA